MPGQGRKVGNPKAGTRSNNCGPQVFEERETIIQVRRNACGITASTCQKSRKPLVHLTDPIHEGTPGRMPAGLQVDAPGNGGPGQPGRAGSNPARGNPVAEHHPALPCRPPDISRRMLVELQIANLLVAGSIPAIACDVAQLVEQVRFTPVALCTQRRPPCRREPYLNDTNGQKARRY